MYPPPYTFEIFYLYTILYIDHPLTQDLLVLYVRMYTHTIEAKETYYRGKRDLRRIDLLVLYVRMYTHIIIRIYNILIRPAPALRQHSSLWASRVNPKP
jgi:hypothetical protein